MHNSSNPQATRRNFIQTTAGVAAVALTGTVSHSSANAASKEEQRRGCVQRMG